MGSGEFILVVGGEPMDTGRHSIFREIKAVTAHALAVESGPSGFTARFVIDV
jgi:SHS2 domain-containing protein